MNIKQAMERSLCNESDLTISVMNRVIDRLEITDPSLLWDVYETVYFTTGDWPEGEGFGSSDFNCVLSNVEKQLTPNETT